MTKEEIGKAIEERRKKFGLKQSYVIDKTGIRQAAISDIENAKTKYNIDYLLEVVSALGGTIEIKWGDLPKIK